MSGQLLLPHFLSDSNLFLVAACVGFAAAVPLGPISILTIHRAMAHGFLRAFVPALGAVLADGIFGLAAGLGANLLTESILAGKFWLRLAGSVLLLAIGAALLSRQSGERASSKEDFSQFRLAVLNFTLVLSNPLTLAFFLAAFTTLGSENGGPLSWRGLTIGAGVSFGTILWFLLICGLATVFHRNVGDSFLQGVRRGVGGLFVLLGLSTALFLLVLS